MDPQLVQEQGGPVAQGPVDFLGIGQGFLESPFSLDGTGIRIPQAHQQIFLEGRRIGDHLSPCIVHAAAAIVGEHVLPVVLDSHIVAVHQGDGTGTGLVHEQVMAFPVLVEGVGRTGQVAEDLGPVLLQQLRYIIMIVFRPAVFAQKDPQFQLPAPEGKGDRLHQVFDGHIRPQFRQQFGDAVEVPAVVEFPVVRQGSLADEGVGQAAPEEFSVLGHKSGIVLPQPAVFIDFGRVGGNVSENYAQAFTGGDNLPAPGFAVLEKGTLFPQVAQEIAGDHQFRQEQDVHLGCPGFGYGLEGFPGVGFRIARFDLDLRTSNFNVHLSLAP